MYFLSGFLSIQFEFQRFLDSISEKESVSFSHSIIENSYAISKLESQEYISELFNAISSNTVYESFRNNSLNIPDQRIKFSVPLYHRAFPIHHYEQNAFWHTYGSILTIGVVLLFSIPAAVIGEAYREEYNNGQLDILSTIKNIYHFHSAAAWIISGCVWLSMLFIGSLIFFSMTLIHSYPLLPSTCLLMSGISLCPLVIIFATISKKSDSIAITFIPMIFLLMIPGMLYFDLAFDVQRNIVIELFLCLLPPSAIAMIIRQVCAIEALGVNVTWTTLMIVSNCPLYYYVLILVFDTIIFGIMSFLMLHFSETKYLVNSDNASTTLSSLKHQCILSIHNLSKSFSFGTQNSIPVLSSFTCDFYCNKIYAVCGSNGAGKSTLLKLLAGLDNQYSGSIERSSSINSSSSRNKVIGWCGQHDALWDYLSIEEHLNFICQLIHDDDRLDDTYMSSLLIELDLQSHAKFLALKLSGGMKRRVSLALAFCGDPMLYVCDEPTTSCDSISRDSIRKALLRRKISSSIVISTHHMEDAEILADTMLFISDGSLVFNGTNNELCSLKNQDSNSLLFSTQDHLIEKEVLKVFSHVECHNDTWIIRSNEFVELKGLIKKLERKRLYSWSLSSPTLSSALIQLFPLGGESKDVKDIQRSSDVNEMTTLSSLPSLKRTNTWSWNIINTFGPIAMLRFHELKWRFRHFLIFHLIVPVLIVYLICIACRDIQYPSLHISDLESLENEVIIAIGKTTTLPLFQVSNPKDRKLKLIDEDSQQIIDNIRDDLNLHIDLRYESSNELWKELYVEYYNHSLIRQGAAVIHDFIPTWLEASIRIDHNSLPDFNASYVFNEIHRAHLDDCKDKNMSMISNSLNPHEDIDSSMKELQESIILAESSPCDINSYSIQLHRVIKEIQNNNVNQTRNEYSLKIRSFASLESNITLLSNVTSDHSSPLLLKELFPILYSKFIKRVDKKITLTTFDLYNHPLQEENMSSDIYIQRGYVGSIMILFYILIISSSSTRVITSLRNEKIKLLFHLKTMSCLDFWISNYVCDVILLIFSFLCVALGIYLGGDPIYSYFFSYPPIDGVLILISLLLFAYAMVASCYVYATLSSNTLSSEIFILLSTICNGIFLKLYHDNHQQDYIISLIHEVVLLLSPSYTLACIVFKMFEWHALVISFQLAGESMKVMELHIHNIQLAIRIYLLMFLWHGLSSLIVVYLIDKYNFQWYSLVYRLYTSLMNQLTRYKRIKGYNEIINERDDIELSHITTKSSHHLLNLSNISVRYQNSNTLALKNISFSISKGESLAILGLNGGGKSTLYNLLCCGNIHPIQGNIILHDDLALHCNPWLLSTHHYFGYTPQVLGYLDYLTVIETLEIFYSIQKKNVKESFDEYISTLMLNSILLSKYFNYPIASLSGGNKKKLLLFIANMGYPLILLLDEVTSGIDPIAAHQILLYLQLQRVYSNDLSLLFTSHRLDECLTLCKRVIVLKEGEICYNDQMTSLIALTNEYYQFDVYLKMNNPHQLDKNSWNQYELLYNLEYICKRLYQHYELQYIKFSQSFMRFTMKKNIIPMSLVFDFLYVSQYNNKIDKYYFREMNMDDILSLLFLHTTS